MSNIFVTLENIIADVFDNNSASIENSNFLKECSNYARMTKIITKIINLLVWLL